MITKYAASILFAGVVALPFAAHADVVYLNQFIVNPGFEVPTTKCCSSPVGWSSGGASGTAGDAGNWNPSSSTGLNALTGSQVGYVNNYSGSDPAGADPGSSVLSGSSQLHYFYLDQTLALPFGMQLGTTYVLTYGVAVRDDITTPLNFRVQINGNYSVAGCTTCDAITSGATTAFQPDHWYYETVSYTAQAADQGLNPTIYLVNDGAVSGSAVLTQAEFDIPVAEPSGGLLLGFQFGALALMAAVGRKALIFARRSNEGF